MRRIFSYGIASAVCACVLMTGCAQPPQQEIAAANKAIESAKDANAPVFAPDQFKAAQDMVNAALADIKAEDKKSSLSRNYEKAKKMLIEATAKAEAAKAAVAANRDKVTEEVKTLLGKAQADVADAKKMVETLIKKKNKEAAALKTKLDEAAASLPSDLSKVADNALAATRDAINNTIASVESVKASIGQLNAPHAPKKIAKKKGKK